MSHEQPIAKTTDKSAHGDRRPAFERDGRRRGSNQPRDSGKAPMRPRQNILPRAPCTRIASGSNPRPARESDFIENILHTIDAELNCRAEVDQVSLRQWLATRREQLARGELVYIAHQLDFVGRRAG